MKYAMKLLPWLTTAGIAWAIGAWFNLYWFQDPAWVTSIYRQKVARADEIQAPRRILLVGGSSTHFGLKAGQLQSEFGIPVINLGLHAGLGLEAILKLVEDKIRPGDIVILFPEHDILAPNVKRDLNILPTLVAFRSGELGILKGEHEGAQQVANRLLLLGSPKFFDVVNAIKSAVLGGQKTGWYDFDVTANGDAVDSLLTKKPPVNQIEVTLSKNASERIARFETQVRQRQATLILGVPWKLAKRTPRTQQELQQVIQALSTIAPVVYDPESLNLKEDVRLFGDTNLHLTKQGRKLRTRELAQQLQPLIQDISLRE